MNQADTVAMTLDQTRPDQKARVVELLSTGAERRRMLDLGILPGTLIENVMRSPLGDPIAFRIRGAVVALRRDQAKLVRVERDPAEE
jgi:ferrous iron transport protein A